MNNVLIQLIVQQTLSGTRYLAFRASESSRPFDIAAIPDNLMMLNISIKQLKLYCLQQDGHMDHWDFGLDVPKENAANLKPVILAITYQGQYILYG